MQLLSEVPDCFIELLTRVFEILYHEFRLLLLFNLAVFTLVVSHLSISLLRFGFVTRIV